MLYQCQKCLKYYDHKYNYLKHINRKTDCKNKIVNNYIDISEASIELPKASIELPKASIELPKASNNITLPLFKIPNDNSNLTNVKTITKKPILINNEKRANYKCLICSKIYANSGGLSKHKKKYHPNYDTELINLDSANLANLANTKIIITKKDFNDINKKIKDLEDKISYTMTNTVNTTNTNNGIINNIINNTTTTTNINNSFQLIKFGKENIYDLNKDEIKKIENSDSPYKQIVEIFHFNLDRPESQNIKCYNINGKYLEIYDGKSWIKIPLDDLLLELYNNHTDNLYEISKMDPENDEEREIKNKLQYTVNDMLKYYEENNKPGSKEFNDDIKLLLYNKTKIMKKEQNQILNV
jgi:hypothetical protein